mmetsp:Transcript_1426/g.1946  ORF Transcript_1426/g.1946 Transcript_1426/m.1946 type:complete len:116 (-) Transcript_1426:619-966(-)
MAGTVYMVMDGSVYMFTTLYFWMISQDWKPYFIVLICTNTVAVLGTLLLPESPRMLLSLGREEEAVVGLQQMARWNGRPLKLDNDVNNSSLLLNSFDTTINTTVDRSAMVIETLT